MLSHDKIPVGGDSGHHALSEEDNHRLGHSRGLRIHAAHLALGARARPFSYPRIYAHTDTIPKPNDRHPSI